MRSKRICFIQFDRANEVNNVGPKRRAFSHCMKWRSTDHVDELQLSSGSFYVELDLVAGVDFKLDFPRGPSHPGEKVVEGE